MIAVDRAWRAAHPLPSVDGGDKEARGRVLVVGGARFVPGALRLTGEAALRVGAGKVQLATVESVALLLGVQMPEAATIALPEDEAGEIGVGAAERLASNLARCDTLLLGPGMTKRPHTAALVEALLAQLPEAATLLLDAAALGVAGDCAATLRAIGDRAAMTPHHGELAGLMARDKDEVDADPATAAHEAAERFGVTIALKDERTLIASPGAALIGFESTAPGLGTAGSGDVLAGTIAGLAARGLAMREAVGWGVWLHGQAGHAVANRVGPTGFLARELLPELPRVMAAAATR